jgi:GAF domain-containing protein
MLADADREWLSVVASRGADVDLDTMSPRKLGEGPSGTCFAEGQVLCVSDAGSDPRFAGRTAGEYSSLAYAVVPLVCLGVPVGVLCLTEGEDPECFSEEESNVLRLLGMQISEFLAADPEVEGLLQAASAMSAEGLDAYDVVAADDRSDGDAELARSICEAVAAEVEPERVLRLATAAVAQQLEAAPVALFLLAPDGDSLNLEAEADGGILGDRTSLPTDRGLVGRVVQTGQLVATEDVAGDARFDAAVDTASDGLVRPLLCVPIKLRSKVVGVLRVFFDEGRSASPRTAEVLAAAFSAAVRNVLLYRSLLQTIEEMADARKNARA